MKKIAEPCAGLIVVEPTVHGDERGWFMESYSKKFWLELGHTNEYVQDNRSFSRYGTLRGLHLQKGSSSQAKLVTCLKGEVLDVVVDLRPNSATRGQHFSVLLTEENKKQMYVPRGFAHGFVVLSAEAEFFYKCDNFYDQKSEIGILYHDKKLNIDWKMPKEKLIVSTKDQNLLTLDEILKVEIL